MELGLLIKTLVIIGVIGGVVVASQSSVFRPAVQGLYTSGVKSDSSYIAKTEEWLKTNIYPKFGGVSGEVAQTQENLQQQITDQKNNLVENSTQAAKKLLAENILKFLGVAPQELGGCPAN